MGTVLNLKEYIKQRVNGNGTELKGIHKIED